MGTHLNAALTSGTSPGTRRRIHLLGAGAVGRALLQRIANSSHALVGVTDSSGTVSSCDGIDARSIVDWKNSRRSLSQHPLHTGEAWPSALFETGADLIIDATPSERREGWAAALESEVLEAGRSLVLIAKTSLGERAASWLSARYAGRIGCNAVLGGTGHSFIRALPDLREEWTGATVVGNASTTTIITVLERGGSFEQGVAEATRLGYLEPDPECDLRGVDAAVKLAIVAGALSRRVYEADAIPCEDIRALQPVVLQARARSGQTTRLVARIAADGRAAVAYEAVAVDSVLAAPCGRVVYQYHVRGGDRHIYIGEGLGAEATAAAAWVDVQSISRSRGAREANAAVAAGAR